MKLDHIKDTDITKCNKKHNMHLLLLFEIQILKGKKIHNVCIYEELEDEYLPQIEPIFVLTSLNTSGIKVVAFTLN